MAKPLCLKSLVNDKGYSRYANRNKGTYKQELAVLGPKVWRNKTEGERYAYRNKDTARQESRVRDRRLAVLGNKGWRHKTSSVDGGKDRGTEPKRHDVHC